MALRVLCFFPFSFGCSRVLWSFLEVGLQRRGVRVGCRESDVAH
jgi:hypothetical protein